jgi:hypothetical protein
MSQPNTFSSSSYFHFQNPVTSQKSNIKKKKKDPTFSLSSVLLLQTQIAKKVDLKSLELNCH